MPRWLSKICDFLDPYVDVRNDWRALLASVVVFVVSAAFIAVNWGRW